jgi:GNAT superfamily N-acetyltransferase
VTELAVERLSAETLRDNVALSRSVGWQDTDSDWRVLHEAATVFGVRRDGQLVAQVALGAYGAAGTVAKMVVAPEVQGQRIGGRLMDALLGEAERRAMPVLGLVATDAGRPLYERRGFTAVGETVVLVGTPAPTAVDAAAVPLGDAVPRGAAVPLGDAAAAAGVEARWMGCSRAALLAARFREAIATSALVGADAAVRAFAIATAQGPVALVGPIVADNEEDARVLFASLFRAAPGPARIDVPAAHVGFRAWLRQLGLREQVTRAEMARGAARLPWQVPQRFALASQAWG